MSFRSQENVHRILLTGFCAVPGPHRVGVQLRYVLTALSRYYNVDALVARHGEQAYVERKGTARILRVPLHDPDMSSQIEAFRRALRRQLEGADYDTVHFRDGWSGAVVLEHQQHFDYQTVFDVTRAPLADAPVMDPSIASDLAKAEKRCLMEADHVLVPSEQAREHVMALGVRRAHVVPPGVDVNLFDWDEPEPGLPNILYAGTIEPGRGVRVLLRSMAEVIEAIDARLLIAGAIEPGFRQSLDAGIRDLDLQRRVKFCGEVEHQDMPELIARATVGVVPSACELRSRPLALYPTKILEYLACRRAVVAPRRGTTRAVIRHGTDGLLFRPGDPMDLADKLVSVLRDGALRTNLAQSGYELVRERFTASELRRCLRGVYKQIVSPKRAAGPSGYTEVITDEALALDSGDGDAEEITETSRIERFNPTYAGGATEPVIQLSAPDREHTDETVLPSSDTTNRIGRDDSWVVSDADKTATWRSLLDMDDGTPIDGVSTPPPDPSLLENRFVSGEINARTPSSEWHASDDTSFTAVSVLLGSVGNDGGDADRNGSG